MNPNLKPSPLSAAVLAACALPDADRARTDGARARRARAEALIEGLAKIDADKAPADAAVIASEKSHAAALASRALGDDAGGQAIKRLRDALVNARTHREGIDLARDELQTELSGIEAGIQRDVESELNGVAAQHAARLWQAVQPEIESAAAALAPIVARAEALFAATGCSDAVHWLNDLRVPGFGVRARPLLSRTEANMQGETVRIADLIGPDVEAFKVAGAGEAVATLAALKAYMPLAQRAGPPKASATSYTTDNSRTVAGEAARATAAAVNAPPPPAASSPTPTAAPRGWGPQRGRTETVEHPGHDDEAAINRAVAMQRSSSRGRESEFTPGATR